MEWMSVSPLSLYYWDSRNLEPWAAFRDVAYLVLSPDIKKVRVFLCTPGTFDLTLGLFDLSFEPLVDS